MEQLPIALQLNAMKYKLWHDQQRFIIGKLLLIKGLELFNMSSKSLNDIQYNEFGRSYLKSDIDFNISHSGEYVVLAIGKKIKLGIDIEKIISIDFSNFENTMCKKEWDLIYKSNNPFYTFFRLWTIKESVIKADSKGLSISLQDIKIYKKKAICASKTWFLNRINIDQQYMTHLSSNVETQNISIEFVEFS